MLDSLKQINDEEGGLGGIIYQLEKNAAYYHYLPIWDNLVRTSFDRMYELLRGDLESIDQLVQKYNINLPPQIGANQLKDLVQQNLIDLLALDNHIIQQWGQYNDSTLSQLESILFEDEPIILSDGLNPIIGRDLGVSPRGLNYRPSPDRIPLSFAMKSQFSLYAREIESILNQVTSGNAVETIGKMNGLQANTRDFLNSTFESFLSSAKGLYNDSGREFQFLFRFPRISSSEVADEILPEGVYPLAFKCLLLICIHLLVQIHQHP